MPERIHPIVVGLGYGDEGKGATVDYLASAIPDARAVVRWSGGAQAAHNVEHGPRHHTFRLFGSGTLLGLPTIATSAVIFDPEIWGMEAAALERLGVHDPESLYLASPDCLVATKIHRALGRAREIARGRKRHGSTGLGIGETVAAGHAWAMNVPAGGRVGNFDIPGDPIEPLRAFELADRKAVVERLGALMAYAEPMLSRAKKDADLELASVAEQADEILDATQGLRIDDGTAVDAALGSGTVIFEGSQGALLDETHGFHPHTTWSTVVPRRLVDALGRGGHRSKVIGVTRVYATRHGAGPMPTEDENLDIPERHNAWGRWQEGWRQGHLDLPELRYAAQVAAPDELAITHLDAVGTDGLKIASTWGGDPNPLGSGADPFKAKPVYAEMPDDPEAVVRVIERAAGARASIVSDGPRRLDRKARS